MRAHQRCHYNRFLSASTHPVHVVLVSPRNPLNIGAAARAMANFGFDQLTVVAPYAPHWREARSAVGAPELLLNEPSPPPFLTPSPVAPSSSAPEPSPIAKPNRRSSRCPHSLHSFNMR